jgi:hypothetical protein
MNAHPRLLAPFSLFVFLTAASGVASALTGTATVLNVGPSPGTAGQPITLFATISPQVPEVPTGTVQFTETANPTVIYTAPVVNGSASLILELPAGTYTYQAVYSGDSNFTGSTSTIVSETVTTSTTTTLSVTPNPALFGQAVTMSAAVSPTGSTGTVTFYDHTNVLGVAPVVDGTATLVTNLLPSGLRTLYARYSGNTTGDATSTSTQISEAVLTKSGLGYGPFVTYPSAGGPSIQVAADFNTDGVMDIAVLNEAANTITIFVGSSTGVFTVGNTLTTGPSPAGMVVGDFNGDGNPDIAVAASDGVEVLYGLGNGSFDSFVTTNIGTGGALSLAVGDFNYDGLPDIAAVNGTTVKVLVSTGSSFNASLFAPVTLAAAPTAMAVGDFNNDSLADLVVITSAGANVLLNTSDLVLVSPTYSFGSPSVYAAGNGPDAVLVKDINGDVNQDLLITNLTDGTVSVLLGNGSGSFAAATAFSAGPSPTSLATCDFNGDGIADLVVTNQTSYNGNSNISVLLGIGNGTYHTPLGYTAGAAPTSVIVGDFNNDSKPDVAVLSATSNTLDILLNLYATIAVSAGNTQAAAVNNTFAIPLQVTTTAFGTPASNVPVTFTAPSSGASGFFNGIGPVATVVSSATGIATAPPYTANGTTGANTVSATAGGNAVTFSLTNNVQVCTFIVSPDTNVVLDARGGSQLFTVTASASNCMWNAASSSPSILFGTTSGTGSGSVDVLFPANTTGADLPETVYIAGIAVPVTILGTTQIFADVPPSSFYFDAVNLLYEKGITAGCSENPLDYCPNTDVTRAQMAVFIVSSVYNGGPFTLNSTVPYFNDVPVGSFGFNWIQKMYELGITSGCGNGDFCPNDNVTRAQMAVFIITARYGASAVWDIPQTPYFTDVPMGAFAYNWIQRMAYDSITAGCGPSLYCPDSDVIRGDMAIFIMKGMFNALYPSTTPEILSITPASIPIGQTTTVTVTGVNTLFDSTTVLQPIPNTTIGTMTVLSPTSFTVQLTPSDSTVTTQPYSIYVVTSDQSQEEVLPNGLTITAAP